MLGIIAATPEMGQHPVGRVAQSDGHRLDLTGNSVVHLHARKRGDPSCIRGRLVGDCASQRQARAESSRHHGGGGVLNGAGEVVLHRDGEVGGNSLTRRHLVRSGLEHQPLQRRSDLGRRARVRVDPMLGIIAAAPEVGQHPVGRVAQSDGHRLDLTGNSVVHLHARKRGDPSCIRCQRQSVEASKRYVKSCDCRLF